MNNGVRWFLAGVVVVLMFGASSAALGADQGQVLVPVATSEFTGYNIENLDGVVTGSIATPAGFSGSTLSVAANGSFAGAGQEGGGAPVWLMHPDGRAVKLDSSSDDLDVSITHDGSKVTFARFDPTTGSSNIYVVNSDGSGLKLVASGQGTNYLVLPTFSPDGGSIAYWCGPPGLLTQAVGRNCGPLADGSYRDSGVMLMNADGSDKRMILIGAGRADQGGGPSSLSWSPDGKWIALEGDAGDAGYQQVFVYRTDGSDLFNNLDPSRQLTHVKGGAAIEAEFTPDGSQILFLTTIDDSGAQGNFLYIINRDGTGRHEIFLNFNEPSSWGAEWVPFIPLAGGGGRRQQ